MATFFLSLNDRGFFGQQGNNKEVLKQQILKQWKGLITSHHLERCAVMEEEKKGIEIEYTYIP